MQQKDIYIDIKQAEGMRILLHKVTLGLSLSCSEKGPLQKLHKEGEPPPPNAAIQREAEPFTVLIFTPIFTSIITVSDATDIA